MIQIHHEVDADFGAKLEEYFLEWDRSPWMLTRDTGKQPYQLYGYFESSEEALQQWSNLRLKFKKLPEEIELTTLDDRDWKEAYKDHFKPWQVGHLHWVPEWERDTYQLPEGDSAVYLDPGMAFGTGDHPTTRLCAEEIINACTLWKDDLASKKVIDAGCGSGILAISAYALGFTQVFGFDNDPEAIKVSLENIELNGFEGKVDFVHAGIEQALKDRTCDLMVANIQADVLSIYAENLINAINPKGILALSGILGVEVEQVRSHFDAAVARLGRSGSSRTKVYGEWSSVVIEFTN